MLLGMGLENLGNPAAQRLPESLVRLENLVLLEAVED